MRINIYSPLSNLFNQHILDGEKYKRELSLRRKRWPEHTHPAAMKSVSKGVGGSAGSPAEALAWAHAPSSEEVRFEGRVVIL